MYSSGPNGPQHSGGPVGLHGGHGGHHAVGDNHEPVVGNGNGSLSPNGPNGGQTSLDRNSSSLERTNSSLDRNNRDASGDIYRQLIDSSDLVKELDDIEAISQQISQHAEVLYQNWKSNSQPRAGTPTTPTSPRCVLMRFCPLKKKSSECLHFLIHMHYIIICQPDRI